MAGRLFLIHWNDVEAEDKARALREDGWDVQTESADGARGAERLLADPPDVVVIWLTRLPSHGRATAHYFRSRPAGRSTPIVFVGGEGAALEKVRSAVPDAVYTSPGGLVAALAPYL